MRRTAALAAALALIASGVALAAPANAATLKPGAVTNVMVTPDNAGHVTVTWKAPVVKKGKSAKATSYTVVCGTAKKVTVKSTSAKVTVVTSGYKDGVLCSVSAVAGKALGKATKSKVGVTAYVPIGSASFNLTAAAMTGLSNALNAIAPATLTPSTEPADFQSTITFPIVARDAVAGTETLAGGFLVGSASFSAPVTTVSIVPDPATKGSLDVQGFIPALGSVKTILILSNVTSGANNTGTFSVSLTNDKDLTAIFPTFGITLAGGAAMGAGTFQ